MCENPAKSLMFIIGKRRRAAVCERQRTEIAKSERCIAGYAQEVQKHTVQEAHWKDLNSKKKAVLEDAQEQYQDVEAKHLGVQAARIKAEMQLQRYCRRRAITSLLSGAQELLNNLPDEDSWANSGRFPIAEIRENLGLKSTEAVVFKCNAPWQCLVVLKAMKEVSDFGRFNT